MSSFSEAALIGWDTRLAEGGICDLCGSGDYLIFALGMVKHLSFDTLCNQ